jgi:sugar-specific transcriptional regulator TrmB
MGLAWDEVRIYQFLLNSSSAISSAIVRETGHSRGRIYEALRRLVSKGLVREEPTRPIQFHPTPLSEILAMAHTRLTRQLAAVKAGQGLVLAAGEPEVNVPLLAPTRARDVRVFSGRRACHAEWARMLDAADDFFWLTGGENFARRLASMPGLLRSLAACRDKGLTVQVVLPKQETTKDALVQVRDILGPDVLHVASADEFGPLVSCTTDQAAMEVICQPDDVEPNQGQDVGIQVSSQLFAQATKHRVTLAEKYLKRKGTPPIYQWLGPNHGSDLFLEAVRKAEKQVLVLGPREWSRYLAVDWQRNAAVYKAAKTRGVQFRAVTSRDDLKKSALSAFGDVWDIRVVDWHPVWLTIVDGTELFQAFTHPSLGGPPQFRQSREPHEIKFYSTVFEGLWTLGHPT